MTDLHRRIVVMRRSTGSLLCLLALDGFASVETTFRGCFRLATGGLSDPRMTAGVVRRESSPGRSQARYSVASLLTPAPNKNNTNPEQSRFVFFFTRDYYEVQDQI